MVSHSVQADDRVIRLDWPIIPDPGRVGEADLLDMKRQGFSEEDVWDAMAVTAFFAMSNRLANTAGVKPNAAFYTMGRE